MKQKLPGWKKLNELAGEYYSEVQKGFGTEVEYENGKLIDNRSDRQKELAREIINGSMGYIDNIAKNLFYGKKLKFNVKGKTRNFYLFNNGNMTVDDLVGEISWCLIRRLKNYKPEFGSISTFISYNAVSAISRYSKNNTGMLHIPENIVDKIKNIIKEEGKRTAIEKIIKSGMIEPRSKDESIDRIAGAIYFGLANSRYVSIHEEIKGNNHPVNRTFEEVFLKDEKTQTDEKVIQKELQQKISKVLSSLNLNEEKVIRMARGIGYDYEHSNEEIAQALCLTSARICQIKREAFRKLRHPSRTKKLKDFL